MKTFEKDGKLYQTMTEDELAAKGYCYNIINNGFNEVVSVVHQGSCDSCVGIKGPTGAEGACKAPTGPQGFQE